MENLGSNTGTAKTLREVAVELAGLRDSLVKLSLALHDLQFEIDLERRRIAERVTGDLLKQMASSRNCDAS